MIDALRKEIAKHGDTAAIVPANKKHLKTAASPVEFTEEDTAYLIQGETV